MSGSSQGDLDSPGGGRVLRNSQSFPCDLRDISDMLLISAGNTNRKEHQVTTYVINRSHVSPDSDEHAAMCWQQERVDGTWQDAKNKMADMVVAAESPERAIPFLRGLISDQSPVDILGLHTKWRGLTWTEGNIRWAIRES